MKNIINILFMLISVSCFAQQPAAMDPILVQDLDFTLVRPEFGKIYRVMLRKDHALLAEGIADSTWVQICYGCQIPSHPGPDPVATDTVDGFNLVYTGWNTNSVIADPTKTPGWHKNTISYSTTGEAKYTFTGTGVELWAEKLPSHGTGSVTVGTETKTASWTGAKQLPSKIVEFKGLASGQHTIIVKPVSGYILIDYLVITK